MNKVVSVFLDRLAERFTALLAGLVSSRVAGLHAAVQAEQQSQLEDLARGYEADGKPDIAKELRERASRLTSPDLVGEAIEVIHRVTTEDPRLAGPAEPNFPGTAADLRSLPRFESPTKSPRKRRVSSNTDPGNPVTDHSS
jgi:hypothetical protein